MFEKMIHGYVLVVLFLISNIHATTYITIGTIDSEPEEKIGKFQPLADYLEEKLKQHNIEVYVEVPKDVNTAIKLINEKKLDIYIDSVYPSLMVQKKTDLSIVCKRWKNGSQGYKSLIFTNKNSSINTLHDLAGKTIAFEDEFSTSAYYVPKKAIEKQGLTLSNDGDAKSIKYSFAKSEKNAAVWVIYAKADAAATDEISYNSYDKKLFKVIYKSQLIPRHLVSFSSKINSELKKDILEILYNMHKDKKGQEVLKSFSKTKKFSPLNQEDLELIKDFK